MTEPQHTPPSVNSSPPSAPGSSALASPHVRPYKPVRWSWIWLVPLVAAIVGASLLFRTWWHIGPTVKITFESAEGLAVGQTKLRYKDIVVGEVSDIEVSKDRTRVVVSVQLERDGSEYLTRKEARFWVVRPRLGLSGVSGLGTLLSGAYIAVDTPVGLKDNDTPVYEFTGLETPPEITSGRPGSRFVVKADDLGSLDIGSPVYYRRIHVGQVIGYSLSEDGRDVDVQLFVDAPNDRFVTTASRFWNASGVHVNLSADGLNVHTESLVSMLAGGVAFENADDATPERAKAGTHFELFETRDKAMAEPDGPPFIVEFHFPQSVRGLKVGAPIDFRGLELGQVVDINLEFDKTRRRFYAQVRARLYPLRFGAVYDTLMSSADPVEYPGAPLLGPLVEHGMRAQLRSSNILTGQQYIALDFFPDALPERLARDAVPVVLPTVEGNFDRLQQQITSIVTKLEAIPFDAIGNDLRDTLASANKLLEGLDKNLAPQATSMLRKAEESLDHINRLVARDSPINTNLEQSLEEIRRAARSMRMLVDYLQANPSSVLRGQPAQTFEVTP